MRRASSNRENQFDNNTLNGSIERTVAEKVGKLPLRAKRRKRCSHSIFEVSFALIILVSLVYTFMLMTLVERRETNDLSLPSALRRSKGYGGRTNDRNHSTGSTAEVVSSTKPFEPLLPYGFVFDDLATRVLSRIIAESNVLIVGETSAAKSFGNQAQREGHTLHSLANGANLDNWWNRSSKPGWILFAFIQSSHSTLPAEIFFTQSTVTYIVLIANSRRDHHNRYFFQGLDEARALLRHGYKLQILLTSHYRVLKTSDYDHSFRRYGPNTLLKTVTAVEQLLKWGADTARYFGGTDYELALFATQGLDLAIPSRSLYISDQSRIVKKGPGWTQINMYKPILFHQCPQRGTITIRFANDGFRIDIPSWTRWRKIFNPIKGTTVIAAAQNVLISSNRPTFHDLRTHDDTVYVWHSAHIPITSEAVCVYHQSSVTCATRILTKPTVVSTQPKSAPQQNILLILIDPISRSHFDRTMPKTKRILEELQLIRFQNYSVVGPNSGPNQAALYSGTPLQSRDGINVKGNNGHAQWLWDRLNAFGYSTFKAEDGCIENSNMLQSLQPNTTHGEALSRYFCFDFDRPNCLGGEPASKHLIKHAMQFIEAYNSKTPWAAFVHFVDTHEDTMTLSSVIDSYIADFLLDLRQKGHLSNAGVYFMSDHGLHYGPYFQATEGEQERAEPLLYMGMPGDAKGDASLSLQQNSGMFVTPFDVHLTMLHLTFGHTYASTQQVEGISLLTRLPSSRLLCETTQLIPLHFCKSQLEGAQRQSTRMKNPPSIMSFFADIPQISRELPVTDSCDAQLFPLFTCYCMTSHRDWFSCYRHPWGNTWRQDFPSQYSHEFFAVFKCDAERLRLDTRAITQGQFSKHAIPTSQRNSIDQEVRAKTSQPMNILFIEIDSVSRSFAHRHLPRTLSLLERHRPDDMGGCNGHSCAVEFPMSALSGPNSLTNQVSPLSGCLVTRFHESCLDEFDNRSNIEAINRCPNGSFPLYPLASCGGKLSECCTEDFQGWNASLQCKDMLMLERNLQFLRQGPRRESVWCPVASTTHKTVSSPWLFDVAKKYDYITLFGEEFCFHGSPFVPQESVFSLDVDYPLERLFCRLKNAPYYRGPREGPRVCTKNTGKDTIDPPLLGFLESIWEAHPNTPKFGFINTMVAHNFEVSLGETIMHVEEYDRYLASFLAKMLRSNNTFIVLRGDHGIQGGPTTVDYSVQIEHRQPWYELIVPESMGAKSMKTLKSNSNRLVTGFDLYRTLRAVIDPSVTSSAPMPDWSYDLLSEDVPLNRSCFDARIPREFCPLMGESSNLAPQFGVCNSFDDYSDLFCA